MQVPELEFKRLGAVHEAGIYSDDTVGAGVTRARDNKNHLKSKETHDANSEWYKSMILHSKSNSHITKMIVQQIPYRYAQIMHSP